MEVSGSGLALQHPPGLTLPAQGFTSAASSCKAASILRDTGLDSRGKARTVGSGQEGPGLEVAGGSEERQSYVAES